MYIHVYISQPHHRYFPGGSVYQPTNLSNNTQNLVKANNFFSYPNVNPERIIQEPHATDSYQNVLFSLLRFRIYTGVYPTRVTVITHEFKRGRFFECHFPALGLVPFPASDFKSGHPGEQEDGKERERKVELIGINPPPEVTSIESLNEGEEKSGIGLWRRDLYGVGSELAGKRSKRGWTPGMEDGVFVNVGLEGVVEELVVWDGGETGNEWFRRIQELPWYRHYNPA